MPALGLTLVGDGPSDACLVPIVEWTVREIAPDLAFRIEVAAEYLPPLRDGLRKRLVAALKLFPCQILLVHRDAEGLPLNERIAQIRAEALNLEASPVAIVPVRMTEAWLFSDEAAIRSAADNPNGTDELDLPPPARWERLPNAKQHLFDTLRTASGLNVSRRQRFNAARSRTRIAQLTSGFDALRVLESFRAFEAELRAALETALTPGQ